jgi:hypothetical protein
MLPGRAKESVESSLMIGGCCEMSEILLLMGKPPMFTATEAGEGMSSLQDTATSSILIDFVSTHIPPFAGSKIQKS